MDKNILRDYIDACELIKETEEDIRKLHKTEKVYDKVKGSNPKFPYQPQGFNMYGVVENSLSVEQLRREEKLLRQRKENANQIKCKVEEWMNTIPVRMQRIIRYRIFQGLSWNSIAIKMGRCTTADSVRMEYYNFMKNKK